MSRFLKRVSQRVAAALQLLVAKSVQLQAWLKKTRLYRPLLQVKRWLDAVTVFLGILLSRLKTWWDAVSMYLEYLALVYVFSPRPSKIGGSQTKPLEIVMLVVSELRIDPRVQREAQALACAGYHVKIIVPDNSKPRLADVPLDWGTGIEIIPLPGEAASYIMTYPFVFGRMMYDRAIQEKPFAFHCHDLTTALIGLIAARKVGARCVCDFHEWWSELAEWDRDKQQFVERLPKTKRFLKFAERLVMSRADEVITVCDSIANELLVGVKGSPAKVTVIRNIPDLKPSSNHRGYGSLRESLQLRQDQQLVIYQGGIGPSRNLEAVIDALAYAPHTVLVLRGPAMDYYGDAYMTRAAKAGAHNRLFCFGPVPSEDVVAAAAASGAVAGLYTVAPLCLSWKYALPNKLFEYMAAGLPILAADYPEVRKLVDHYGIGISFDAEDPRSIGAAFNRLAAEPELATSMCTRLAGALADLNAEKEWQKIVDLYGGLVARSRA